MRVYTAAVYVYAFVGTIRLCMYVYAFVGTIRLCMYMPLWVPQLGCYYIAEQGNNSVFMYTATLETDIYIADTL